VKFLKTLRIEIIEINQSDLQNSIRVLLSNFLSSYVHKISNSVFQMSLTKDNRTSNSFLSTFKVLLFWVKCLYNHEFAFFLRRKKIISFIHRLKRLKSLLPYNHKARQYFSYFHAHPWSSMLYIAHQWSHRWSLMLINVHQC